MAKQIVCDICGKVCDESGRYELIYKSVIRMEKEDICLSCIRKIKEMTRKSNS